MKNGTCPMCTGSEIYTNPETEFRASREPVELSDIDNELQLYLIPYICMNCGFVTMFAADMDEIRNLPEEDGWERVK